MRPFSGSLMPRRPPLPRPLGRTPCLPLMGALSALSSSWLAEISVSLSSPVSSSLLRSQYSLKRMALPRLEKSMMSLRPDVRATPTRLSPSLRAMALMPTLLTFLNAESCTFFTTPMAVAKKTYSSSGKSRTGRMAETFSFSSSWITLLIGRPRELRPPSGSLYTLIQWQRPWLVKHIR